MTDIRPISALTRADREIVGDRYALLGELSGKKIDGVTIAPGFVIEKGFFEAFFEHNKLKNFFKNTLAGTNLYHHSSIESSSKQLTAKLAKSVFSEPMKSAILKVLKGKGKRYVVKSCPVAENTEMEIEPLLEKYRAPVSAEGVFSEIKKIIIGYYSADNIFYVLSKGYDYRSLPLAFLIEEGALDDQSGIATADGALTEIKIKNGSLLSPVAEVCKVYRPALSLKLEPVISRITMGKGKEILSDKEVTNIAQVSERVTKVFGSAEISWRFNREKNKIIVTDINLLVQKTNRGRQAYYLERTGIVLTTGQAIGSAIGAGPSVILNEVKEDTVIEAGSVLFVKSSDERFGRFFAQANAVVTEEGSQESFAARFCRERGIACVTGVKKIKQLVKAGQMVTVSCAEGGEGKVYKGILPFKIETEEKNQPTSTTLLSVVTDSDNAKSVANLPFKGVGLLSEETLYAKHIGIHPQALVYYPTLPKKLKDIVEEFAGDKKPAEYAARRLAEEIAKVASAFDKKEVVFRLSPADTSEFTSLIGGNIFEKKEKNPAMGWRGVARFIDKSYSQAFAITTTALNTVREKWGLHNVSILVPFCRTLEEGKEIIKILKAAGLEQGKNGLKIYVMCEIPSNALLAEEFIQLFDGFEIGLNRLTELTLGADRSIFNETAYHEEDRAVKQLIREVIRVAHRHGKVVGMCDAVPSNYPHFASFLVQEGIDRITVMPDRWRPVEQAVYLAEKKMNAVPMRLPLKIMSKAVSVASFVGLSLMLTGYTCQTVNVDQLKQELISQSQKEIAEFKQKLADEIAEERAKEKAAATRQYHERGYADFSVDFPADWKVANQPNGVEFLATTGTGRFMVRREFRRAMKEYNFSTTTIWKGNDVGLYSGNGLKGAVIFPVNKIYKEVIVLEGDEVNFDRIWQSMENFSWVPKLK